jgi:hypothetical protein
MRVRAPGIWPLLLATSAAAQTPSVTCSDTLTIAACWDIVSSVGTTLREDAAETEVARATDRRLQAKTVGVPVPVPGAATAISDFLPLLAGAFGVKSTSDPDGAMVFEGNLPIPIGVNPQRARIRAVLNRPRLYQPLAELLPADTREATRTSLEQDLGDFDDVALSVALNVESKSFGRSFGNYTDLYGAFFQDIWTEAEAQLGEASEAQAIVALQRAAKRAGEALVPGDGCNAAAGTDLPLRCIAPAERKLIVESLAETAAAGRAMDSAMGERMRRGGFLFFADMINNQPQLNIQGEARIRQDLVGPDEYSVTGRFEMGFVNVNRFRGTCRAAQRAVNLACLDDYLQQPGTKGSLARGDRVWLSAKWTSRQEVAETLAAQGVTLRLAGSSVFEVAGGLGRYVAVDEQGVETGRVDLSAEYVATTDDAVRNDRFLASLSYTHRVNDNASLLVGLAYANRPEFLTDVDRKVSANFGLRYRLSSPAPPIPPQ